MSSRSINLQLFALLVFATAIPPLVAQEPSPTHHHAKVIDNGMLSGPNSHQRSSSRSLVLSGEDSLRLNYWSLLSVLVDDQNGAPSVDPLSLQPPAILQVDAGILHVYKACWKVAHPGPLDPPGTAIKCYSSPGTFELGDGSLASTPNSNPDSLFSGLPCPLTGPQQFLWFDQLTAYWNVVRFYNANEQLIEGYRHEVYAGKIYNYTTGKSIPAWMDYMLTYTEEPGPDGTQNNLQYGYYGNDFSVQAVNSQILTPLWGTVIWTPNFGSVVKEVGSHPFDDYFTGATAGLAPICDALQ
jgi:hypothetical protein